MSHEQTWTNPKIDKSAWPEGPWTTEPDKVQWVDDATGLDCLAFRNTGFWCGYVGLPPEHLLHGKAYQDVDAIVHGGLTFSGPCHGGHGDSAVGICHVPLPGRPARVHWLGFDCVHSGDLDPSRIGWNRKFHEAHPEFGPYLQREEYRTLSKLWLLRPAVDGPWTPWYDKSFGFVVRAETEEAARRLAARSPGDEGADAWTNSRQSSCVELPTEGESEVVMQDFRSA